MHLFTVNCYCNKSDLHKSIVAQIWIVYFVISTFNGLFIQQELFNWVPVRKYNMSVGLNRAEKKMSPVLCMKYLSAISFKSVIWLCLYFIVVWQYTLTMNYNAKIQLLKQETLQHINIGSFISTVIVITIL